MGTARGEARRAELLELVTDHVAAEGIAGFSLRRAAQAAGTTHKVLLYYFDGPEDLLGQVLLRLRRQRIDNLLEAITQSGARTLSESVRAIWPVLQDDELGLRVIDQAIGLAMSDPARYAHLAAEAVPQYVGPLLGLCPPGWTAERKLAVVHVVLGAFRGFLMEWQTSRSAESIVPAVDALAHMLELQESAP